MGRKRRAKPGTGRAGDGRAGRGEARTESTVVPVGAVDRLCARNAVNADMRGDRASCVSAQY